MQVLYFQVFQTYLLLQELKQMLPGGKYFESASFLFPLYCAIPSIHD